MVKSWHAAVGLALPISPWRALRRIMGFVGTSLARTKWRSVTILDETESQGCLKRALFARAWSAMQKHTAGRRGKKSTPRIHGEPRQQAKLRRNAIRIFSWEAGGRETGPRNASPR